MNNTIRILALNDDNHATTFYSEDHTIEMKGYEFIPFLAQAHSINYEIRGVYICDIPEMEEDGEDIFINAFEVVDCNVSHDMTWDEAFNLLWSIAGKDIYL